MSESKRKTPPLEPEEAGRLLGVDVQIFGLKASSETRAAERFFKERRAKIHFVDLNERPISPGEINRFIQKFGLNALLDLNGKAYIDANLEYLRVTDAARSKRRNGAQNNDSCTYLGLGHHDPPLSFFVD